MRVSALSSIEEPALSATCLRPPIGVSNTAAEAVWGQASQAAPPTANKAAALAPTQSVRRRGNGDFPGLHGEDAERQLHAGRVQLQGDTAARGTGTHHLGADRHGRRAAARGSCGAPACHDEPAGAVVAVESAEHKAEEFAVGHHNDIHGTMIATEQAEISLHLLANVRNRVVDLYREVMRMGS